MEVVLVLLVLQFLLAAVAWIGSVPLPRFRLASGPGWLQVELTRIVLPLLMIVAGFLFFSRPLAPTWGPGRDRFPDPRRVSHRPVPRRADRGVIPGTASPLAR